MLSGGVESDCHDVHKARVVSSGAQVSAESRCFSTASDPTAIYVLFPSRFVLVTAAYQQGVREHNLSTHRLCYRGTRNRWNPIITTAAFAAKHEEVLSGSSSSLALCSGWR